MNYNPLASIKANSILQDAGVMISITNQLFTERIQPCIDKIVQKKADMGVTHFYYGKQDLIGQGKIGERLIRQIGTYLQEKYKQTPDLVGNITIHCGCCEDDFVVGMFGTFFCKEGKNYIIVLNTELRETYTSVRFYRLEKFMDVPLYQGKIGGSQRKTNVVKLN